MPYLLLLFLLSLSGNTKTSGEPIYLKRGEAFHLKSQGDLFIENGDILKAYEMPNGYRIVGKKLGATSLRVDNKTYDFQVLYKQDYDYFQDLKEVIANKRGIEIDFNGKCSILKGRILLWKDYLEIVHHMQSKINHSCKDRFLLKAKFQLFEKNLEERLDKLFEEENLEIPSYSLSPFLKFQIASNKKEQYEKFLNKHGFLFTTNKEYLAIQPNIETKIFVLEIRKSELLNLGVDWPSPLELEGKKLELKKENFSLSVHALEESGKARVLASPKILTANGKEGSFLAGGELPIRASGYQFSKVVWKTYGIHMKVKPKSDAKNNIYLDLSVEISMPDYANRIDGLPGFLKNKMSSQFFLKNKEYLLLSGLIKQENSDSKRGLPLLSKIPVLGSFFGSDSYQKQQTELVIMVKPHIKRL